MRKGCCIIIIGLFALSAFGGRQAVFQDTKTHKVIVPPASGSAAADVDFSLVTATGLTFRQLIDVPSSYAGQSGKAIRVNPGETALEFFSAGGSGTVTSFSAGTLSPLFTTSVGSPTTTPALSFTLSNAGATTVFGNNTASSAAPVFSSAPRFLKIGNLTSNGFVKTSGSDGTLSIDTSTYGIGTVTATGGSLTANAVVLGAGTTDTKVSTGIITDGASKLTLGLNTSTLGQVKLFGNTSGDATIQPAAVAGTATVVTLPNASSTLPIFGQQITFAGPTAARTVTYPDANFTVARTDAANTFTGASTGTSWTMTTPVIASGLSASGSGGNDFSGSTGTFRTSSGAVTIGPGAIAVSGITTFSPPARSSGVASYFTLNIPADTSQTAATESIGYQHVTATRQWASTGTVALQRENFLAGPTYSSASASQTFTDPFTLYLTPPVAGTNAIFTRGHTLGIVDGGSAAAAITGGLVVATTLGTSATSVGIGGGNINAGGTVTANSFTGAGTGLTGTAASLTAGNVTTDANLTGPVTSAGNATTIVGPVTNAMSATMAANTVTANATGGVATPTDVTAATARSSSLLNIDQVTTHGDSNYTILATDRTVVTSASFTAGRTWTLPAANAVNAGQSLTVADIFGAINGVNGLTVSRAGSDTIEPGATTTVAYTAAKSGQTYTSDGSSKWYITGFQSGTGAAQKFLIGSGTNLWVPSGYTVPATPSTSGKLAQSDGTNLVMSTPTWPTTATAQTVVMGNGTNFVATDVGAWDGVVKVSGSDATTTGQALVDITGLVTPTLSNSTQYQIEVMLIATTSADATGVKYGIHGAGTGTAATCNAALNGTTTTNALGALTISAVDTASANALLTTASINGTIVIKGWVTTTSTGTATISIQHLKVTSGTSTVKIGSELKWKK